MANDWLPDSGKFIVVDGTTIPAPDDYTWGIQDVSASDAGRTNDADAKMWKMRITQKRKMTVSWKNRSRSEVSGILNAFQPEYVNVKYLDSLSGEFETREFYTGDKSTAFRCVSINGHVISTVSFNLIER